MGKHFGKWVQKLFEFVSMSAKFHRCSLLTDDIIVSGCCHGNAKALAGWIWRVWGGCKMISRGGCLTAFGIRIFECQAPIWIEVHCVCACVCVCVQMLFCCSDDWAYYTVWYRPDRPLEPRLKRGFLCVWKWQTERQQSSTDQRADGQHEQTAGEVICLT